MTTTKTTPENAQIVYRGRNLHLQTIIAEVKGEPSFAIRSHSKRLALERQFWAYQTELDKINRECTFEGFQAVITEIPEFVFTGFPTHKSPFGLYLPEDQELSDFVEVQYGVFSDPNVALKGLKKLDSSQPVLFGIISRIKETGVDQLNDFFERFVFSLVEHGVKRCDITLGGLDLSRLGRRYSSFAALLMLFELASDNDVGLTLMGSSSPVALFGMLTGAIAQTDMKFNQTISLLRSSLKKGLGSEDYVQRAVSNLFNNKTAYRPHLCLEDYVSLISSRLNGNTDWIDYIK